ncbi:iron-containing alcohol dehydrogenase [Paenibacillus mendelii]|uniref:Iron-containing alcohol dehydrogenase n=1 Tax=Paenibacillus mendelii TaxID=206163 RepID=A0ABV6J6V3_9BACL|nr:iron-containing alcohol dehydrogenase [Paenibacillus mendelii]MCQ6561023.1 iron-containing alcohol dehydrogenase [Paenibacillus mendelii]
MSTIGHHDFRMPGAVRFGVNALLTLPDEIKHRPATKLALISDKGVEGAGLVQKVIELLQPLSIPMVVFTEIKGEPTFNLLESTVRMLQQEGCDLVVGIGGGSAMDVAKTTAALLDKADLAAYLSGVSVIESRTIPCILLPTTSGTGAEVTMNAIFGDEEQELKRGLVSPALLPDVAIIDPLLTLTCPAKVTAASGVDAFTHAIESYIAVRSTLMTRMYAEKAMKIFPQHITRAVHHGGNLEARIGMSLVSNLAGVSLANAGVGAVHALAYPLGGKYHIEHGVANALLMPYVFEVTGRACTEQMVQVAKLLQLGDFDKQPYEALDAVVQYMYRLLDELDLPTSLKQLGVDEASLPVLAEQASKVERLLSNTPYNLTYEKIVGIYKKAYSGQ